ncbi:predicted protein [Nematostella vectensis]|uniref:Steroid 21-hydroxylase n=1 Tax=Nematostella vectensis TaxID=45351 RepID=A7S0I4_NEMVE|nr:predicted protein [Nematostella vectensis]|eukprot:XP_001634799.1 predicted protein [Nematostella vectensis]
MATPTNLPDGPKPLPLIGNLHNIAGSEIHLAVTKLVKDYGDVFTLRILGESIVFINSGAAAKEAMLGKHMDDFAGRPKKFTFDYITRNCQDIILGDYSRALNWRRKVFHSALRMYAPRFDNIIREQIVAFESRMDASEGLPVDSRDEFALLILNIICSFVCGKTYSLDDPEFKKIKQFNIYSAEVPVATCILNIFPWLIHFPLKSSRLFKGFRNTRDEVLDKIFLAHKETFQEGNIRDLADALLQAKIEIEREDKKAVGMVTDDHVIMMLSDIFGGGLESTISSLRWCVAFLIYHPEVQARAQAELDDVIGEKFPTLADREKLPYIEAVIAETLRMGSNVPLAIPHKAIRDTAFRERAIPKGTTVLLNLWAIHRDPKEWSNPEEFYPGRFINSNGEFEVPSKLSFLPFSLGRRVCVGQSVAKAELFLIVARMIQRYTFETPRDTPRPCLEGVVGVTRYIEDFKFCARPRTTT